MCYHIRSYSRKKKLQVLAKAHQSLSKERKWTNCSLSGHNFLRVFADAQLARYINDPIQIMLAKFFETVFWAYTIINFQRCISQDDVTEFVFKFISSTSLEEKKVSITFLNPSSTVMNQFEFIHSIHISKVPIKRTGPIIRTVLISGGSYCSVSLLHYSYMYCLEKKWILLLIFITVLLFLLYVLF